MAEFGDLLPQVTVPPPGPASRALAERLRGVESRNVTFLGPGFPVFWEEAKGANVRDADGNVYLDLTAAFGVALLGHRDPAVEAAATAQSRRLVHGMGDVHPPAVKVAFLERLAAAVEAGSQGSLAEPRAVLATSGSEAVEVALKTAHLATGRPGVVAFRGGYHGLTLGALSATARPYFRAPFRDRVPGNVAWAPYPVREEEVSAALALVEGWLALGIEGTRVGAVVVEPVQARGGVRIPAPGFGERLSALSREYGTILVADEIYTGLGRCGALLASERVGLSPEVVCLGKVLGGGLPLSACVGTRQVMDAWPASPGEALHTSTFLGHPVACAAGMAVLERVRDGVPERARALGGRLLQGLREALQGVEGVREVRGMGLLLGIELAPGQGASVAAEALGGGILLLPAGDEGEVVELSPPLTLTIQQETAAVQGVARAVRTVLAGG
ncbi:MAG TPA: aspartate aminotransferase family protein [Longimicrobiales bacterium]|nr:aspartate aminotransferase family protein [Longimicrobiales bacterium]